MRYSAQEKEIFGNNYERKFYYTIYAFYCVATMLVFVRSAMQKAYIFKINSNKTTI